MRVYVDTEVVKLLGTTKAFVLEYIFTKAPHYNIKTRLNISAIARDLPISLSSVQRLMKELRDENYLVKEDNLYHLSRKFFNTFEDYKNYLETYEGL
jgi:DNA-binding IclR family transcriptional regulator